METKIGKWLDRQPKGAIITDKRLLSILKRKGLIYDYSKWGYLEGCWVQWPKDEDGYGYRDIVELFANGDAPKGTNHICVEENYKIDSYIKYKGHTFTTKYLDGCFKPYLQKIDGTFEVSPIMSIFGRII